jgi:hypothetical protein
MKCSVIYIVSQRLQVQLNSFIYTFVRIAYVHLLDFYSESIGLKALLGFNDCIIIPFKIR